MKRTLTLIFILSILLCFTNNSCNRNEDGIIEPAPKIYKLKGDYIDKVCVGLSSDKLKIIVYPGLNDNCGNPDRLPYKMINDYYLDNCCNYGINTAYLRIAKEDYNEYIPVDSMYTLIIDKDPYEEYYIDEDRILFKQCNNCFILDTALLNDIIKSDSLEAYFKRIK